MDRKRPKPSGAKFRKKRKEEEEKRAKDKGIQLCSLCMITVYIIQVMNEGLMLIGGI